jgi:DNA-binding LytR/AlgR family response regulator
MDVLLLDIEMPALSGIETARELQETSPGTQIIIITNHRNYALQGYEIRPSNYLIKPVAADKLQLELERARRTVEQNIGETLRINSKDTAAFIPLKDILYIECFAYVLHIHTKTEIYKYIHRLGRMSDALAGKGFCRIHKSVLVNFRHVARIDKSQKTALLVNGRTLPVSELRMTGVLGEYLRFRQSTVQTDTASVCTEAVVDYSDSRSLAGTFG